MTGFSEIKPKDIQKNAISLIGDDWMLVSAGTFTEGDNTTWNTMTASWGGLGFLWNKCVAYVFVRKERHTYDFTEKNNTMTLSFFDSSFKKALQFCGTTSGRDLDKAKETGLKPFQCENNSVAFEQASLILECKKLYSDMLKENCFIDFATEGKHYTKDGLHRVYICEITKAWVKQ